MRFERQHLANFGRCFAHREGLTQARDRCPEFVTEQHFEVHALEFVQRLFHEGAEAVGTHQELAVHVELVVDAYPAIDAHDIARRGIVVLTEIVAPWAVFASQFARQYLRVDRKITSAIVV